MTDLHVSFHEPEPGSPTAPTVLLIHGALDRSSNFARVARALPEYRVVRYTRRGYDGSGAPGAVDLSTHVADARRFVDGPTVAIGHSFGGLVALSLGVEEPERVVAIGVYEPPMPWLDWWPERFDFDDPATAAHEFFDHVVGPGVWEAMPERVREARRLDGAALMGDLALSRVGPLFDLADVFTPVAVAHGTEGRREFTDGAQWLAQEVHAATLSVFEGADHGAHLSHPAEFAEWIRRVAELGVTNG